MSDQILGRQIQVIPNSMFQQNNKFMGLVRTEESHKPNNFLNTLEIFSWCVIT